MTPDVHAAFEMFDWAEQGHLPSAGAVLDQTQSFLDALRFYKREVNLVKSANGQ